MTAGEINYTITRILLSTNPDSYEDYNKLMGILESIKFEFYRRRIAKYEDEKIAKNTDVF